MNEYESFYEANLYPLQNGILRTLDVLDSGFYLTGGTALGRALTGHRYSDDLDFFLNGDKSFSKKTENAIVAIRETCKLNGYVLDESSLLFYENYARLNVMYEKISLKIDFVNDIPFHSGDFSKSEFFSLIDSPFNILSNKLTALYRYEPKDVSDIWAISKSYTFNWYSILEDAKKKEAGIDADSVCEVIRGFPSDLFDSIRWRKKPDRELFFKDLDAICRDIMEMRTNGLSEITQG